MSEARRHTGMIMALYLFGIFMGALDTGIVTPARTIIQNDLGVDDQLGIWMITIYTLAYAAAIPIMGKLADRMGRKKIYLVAIVLFGLGSLLSGLAQDVGSFWMLIGARAVQALGGGGILPIATAEFGTSVPEEKRGMALGLVGAVLVPVSRAVRGGMAERDRIVERAVTAAPCIASSFATSRDTCGRLLCDAATRRQMP